MSRKFAALLLLSTLALAAPAGAGPREGDASITVDGGAFLFDKAEHLDTGPLIGARLGYDLHRNVGIEGSFAFIDSRSNLSASKPQTYAYTYRADVLCYLLPDAPLVPYLAAGGGLMTLNGSELWGNRNSLLLDYGLGGKLFLSDTLAIRADARHLFSFDNNRHSHGEFTLGLTYYFSKASTMAKRDPIPAEVYTASKIAVERPAPVRAVKPLQTVRREEPAVTREKSNPVIPPPSPVDTPVLTKSIEKPKSVSPPPVAVAAIPVAAIAAPSEKAPLLAESCGATREVTSFVVDLNGFEILTTAGVTRYKVMTLEDPTRLSIDLDCTTNGIAAKILTVNRHGVTVVRLGSYPDKLRIVFEFAKPGVPHYKVEKSRQGLKVLFGKASRP